MLPEKLLQTSSQEQEFRFLVKGRNTLELLLVLTHLFILLSTNKSPPGKKNLIYCLNLQSPNPMLLMLHGFTSKFTYLTRVVPNITDFFFAPLEAIIRQIFLPSVTGQSSPLSDSEPELLALPVHLGGLGIINPTKLCSLQYNASLNITQSLSDLILKQSTTYPSSCTLAQQEAKKTSSACSPSFSRERLSHTSLKHVPSASSENFGGIKWKGV